MTNSPHTKFLESLFNAHLTDLKNVFPETQGMFACPICLAWFSIEDIQKQALTDGHVWPEGICQKSGSAIAVNQRVLLCRDCNSTAGSRGDKQMQLREKVKEGEITGKLYGERRMQILPAPNQKPIELRAKIATSDHLKSQLSFEVDKRTQRWARSNPEEQQRFVALVDQDKQCSILIYPHHELNSDLARVGWITSAYLLAFYTFGYRYILQQELDSVREYIRRSFESDTKTRISLQQQSEFLGVSECKSHYYSDPEIGLLIPVDGKERAHLQINFLDYHIRLPFRYVAWLLQAMIYSRVPDIDAEIPQMVQNGECVYIPIKCNKLDGHDCIWDYVLGKPIPVS